MKDNKQNILAILRGNEYPIKQRRIAWLKWKFNQMPAWYRKQNAPQYLEEIKRIQDSE